MGVDGGTLGISTILEYLKLYLQSLKTTNLPDDFRKISNFNQFKNILKSWNGNVCKCSVCADF
jgi:hypothetical protein